MFNTLRRTHDHQASSEAGRRTSHDLVIPDGAVVTPGFIDFHSHYDGQVTWDSRLQASSTHRVTTALMGDCGSTSRTEWHKTNRREQTPSVRAGLNQLAGIAQAIGETGTGVFRVLSDLRVSTTGPPNLVTRAPRLVADLPAGGQRVLQGADGYLHTVVSGVEVYTDGEVTGDLPGPLVRGARSAAGR